MLLGQGERNRYLVNNPLPICAYCKTPGHTENQCRAKANNTNNSTSDNQQQHNNRNTSQPQPLFSFYPRQPSHNNRQNQQNHNNSRSNGGNHGNNRHNNFRSNNNNNNRSLPPSQKYCFRFASGLPCNKPPCMFLHQCEGCSSYEHGLNYCTEISSSSFIPQNGP